MEHGKWYELILPMGKNFSARYWSPEGDPERAVLRFPDGSEKRAAEIIPYLSGTRELTTAPPPDHLPIDLEEGDEDEE